MSSIRQLYLLDPWPPESSLFVGGDGPPLLRSEVIQKLREDLTRLGFDTSRFSGHSFRRGGASSAAAASFNELELQQLGQWRSDAYKLYVEHNKFRLLSLSVHLHWGVPNAQPPEPLALHFASQLA
jgi:hypothetical protein